MFTDEDLKRLKGSIAGKLPDRQVLIPADKADALIARLEAAEGCASELERLLDIIGDEDRAICEPKVNEWRKEAGKV